ncbi:ABC transporter substrate-binding protein [Corynebacterium sp. zg-331]|uniref:ABC transporter substrate-binding protein n=1 Tax=unclassified Corynebacterium TaxID=2624378 RepID=UPI00128DE5A2|nr:MULTISPECIES: ABC transporter substrate-binding protein [unclassified Corynebacterium]MBC3186271.1 ABC transporter substrate-binding protein [Corynebacterium sp. zg-331]MPV52759.1 transporter substrate-binding domain-containing protein [Corynebacterium sp. zg331]
MKKIRKIAATGLAALMALAGCVTNEEPGTPEGWISIAPEASPEVQALVPQEIRERGALIIGTNPPFPPFEFKDSAGNIIGMEMDLARAVASVMGLDLRIIQQDFSKILPAVDAGTIDMGATGFTDTPQRRENYDFVNTLYAGIQWAQRGDGDPIDPAQPCGLTVAVQRTTVSETDDVRPKSEECVARGEKPIEVLSYDTSDSAATALVVGRADALSADSPVTSWAIEKAGGSIEKVGPMIAAAPYGFATLKNSELSIAVASAMQHLIETGDYARILGQWNITDGLLAQATINEEPIRHA